jgi:hypothetical protein
MGGAPMVDDDDDDDAYRMRPDGAGVYIIHLR